MPINIYEESTLKNVANLGDDIWGLPTLLDELENWINSNKSELPKSKYIADIGFDIRENASGGGGVLTSISMKKAAEINLDIFFSEYPGAND